MKYLGLDTPELIARGGIHTAMEISQQPKIWQEVWEQIRDNQVSIHQFLTEAIKNTNRILITGAGTSAFIGQSLRGTFQRNTGMITEAVSSTDIVSHPDDYFHAEIPTLIISFARSGNSPESVAALVLADQINDSCYHLIITCNPQGRLVTYSSNSKKYVFTLPPDANDQSLAMTSSYSGMLLAGLLIARINSLDTVEKSVAGIIKCAHHVLTRFTGELKLIADLDFKRAVFLGSGPFYGTAEESHLKLQELTDGKVICKNDSFLGFRHGPKAVIDDTTLVVYFLASDEYAMRYEEDLIDSMKKGTAPLLQVSISESRMHTGISHSFSFDGIAPGIDEEFLTTCFVIPAQIIAFYKCLQLGLRPDAPSVSGTITRVVEGVSIYPHPSRKLNNTSAA